MNLHKLIFTENACYKAGRKIVPKGIMVHSTGANNPWLCRYVGPDDGFVGKNRYNNHWNQDMDRQVCVHGFIGKADDGTIATYQTLPWDHRGWHAGGAANNTHISFEICEDDLSDDGYFQKVYQEAVDLCTHLCKLYNLTEKNIICHCEGHDLGIASNHGDVMHWFPRHGKSMDTLREDVRKQLAASSEEADKPTPPVENNPEGVLYKVQTGAFRNKGNAVQLQDRLKAQGFSTYLVSVDGLYKVQVGAYGKRHNADSMLDQLKKAGYKDAFITETGISEQPAEEVLCVGDVVKMDHNATVYGQQYKFSSWVYDSTLYVREITDDRIVISTQSSGAVTGAVDRKYLHKA